MGEPVWLVVAFTAEDARRKVRHHLRDPLEPFEDGWKHITLAAQALWYANQGALARHGREFKVYGVDESAEEVREMAPEGRSET